MAFEDAGHLPNVHGAPGRDPDTLPRQRRGTTPQSHGRYPDHDVFANSDHWDPVTRRVVERRLQRRGAIRSFTPEEVRTLDAFCDVVTAQDREPRIDVLAVVDERLASGMGVGYRYDGMPEDAEVWRLVASGLDHAAGHRHMFADLDWEDREKIVKRFAEHDLSGGSWRKLDVSLAWKITTRDILSAFYAHPWAWNEIGFGGPAYPRGYARLGVNQGEPWEGGEATTAEVDDFADGRRPT